jgi:hypothetical protein
MTNDGIPTPSTRGSGRRGLLKGDDEDPRGGYTASAGEHPRLRSPNRERPQRNGF